MKRRKVKTFVIYGMYALSISMLLGGVYFIESLAKNEKFQSNHVEEIEGVEDVVDESDDINDIPVISTEVRIIRPYNNGNVKILKNYYDYRADEMSQEDAIIYYGNTYMQNSGVDYGMGNEFEVVSILDGTVMEIIDDDVMGKTIKIKHNNDLISVYQSMGRVDVSVDQELSQGMILGVSGESSVGSDLGNHLHFELYYKGSIVNPEEYYEKLIGELQ